jgi:arylsulfatase A-like enzyme
VTDTRVAEPRDREGFPRRKFIKAAGAAAAAALAGPSAAFVLIRASRGSLQGRVQPSRSRRPNVLLIVLDTVRSDHMSCYGYHRNTTPYIDEFSRGARIYRNVLSPSYWTVPSHASLFTGLPASAHGANWPNPHLHPRFSVLAEQLRAEGYQTVGLSCNGAFVTPNRGFARGFDVFWNPDNRVSTVSQAFLQRLGIDRERMDSWSAATTMHRRLAKWFAEAYQPDRPFFIFLNYIEPHFPYAPPLAEPMWSKPDAWHKWDALPVDKMMEYSMVGADCFSHADVVEMETLYDEEILYVDRKIRELLDFFRSNGLDERTLVIITSDHGEYFGEHHQLAHWLWVYEPLVRVPLIVQYPDRLPVGSESRLVQSHDIYPTVLEVSGVSWEPQAAHNCRSLLDGDRPEPRWAVSEMVSTWLDPIAKVQHKFPALDLPRLSGPSWALQAGNEKLIVHSSASAELYDLARDPGERDNLAPALPERVRALTGQLDTWIGSFEHYRPPLMPGEPDRSISPSERKAMEALGYIR